MRNYNEIEMMNIDFLQKRGFRYILINLTQNILDHAIFDAKRDLRDWLKETGTHDYSTQEPGQKVMIKTIILSFKNQVEVESSLYRTGTRGDARMWFGSDIYDVVAPDDICGVFIRNKTIYVLNISKIDIDFCCSTTLNNPIKTFFKV